MAKHIIIGAGKIGRGFIAQILYMNEQQFCFVEKSEELVRSLRTMQKYHVYVLGNPELDSEISGYECYTFSEAAEIREKIAEADCIFTSVGGKNLEEIVPILADGIETRLQRGDKQFLNIITCENWKQPAQILKNGVKMRISEELQNDFETYIGLTESVILRSGIENPEDPIGVRAQDYWRLPINAALIKGQLPSVPQFDLMEEFDGFLERKFYTYNSANGTVSYLGTLMGYKKIGDAAYDPFILSILNGVYEEVSQALCKKQNYSLEKQYEFTRSSLAKMQNKVIEDTLERNARDPLRKLGPADRLLGPALMAWSYGITPNYLCVSIAAAIFYENPLDDSAVQLQGIRKEGGVDMVLQQVCKLSQDHPLCSLIKQKVEFLKEKGLILGE